MFQASGEIMGGLWSCYAQFSEPRGNPLWVVLHNFTRPFEMSKWKQLRGTEKEEQRRRGWWPTPSSQRWQNGQRTDRGKDFTFRDWVERLSVGTRLEWGEAASCLLYISESPHGYKSFLKKLQSDSNAKVNFAIPCSDVWGWQRWYNHTLTNSETIPWNMEVFFVT